MRVGITADLRHSMFSAGHPNACLAVAKVFQTLGNEVVFIHKQEGRTWWDDVKELEADSPKCIFVEDFLREAKPLDLLIEIAYTASPLERPRLTTRSVWYCRKPGLFSDTEGAIYGCNPDGRNLEGVSAIWLADIFNTSEDIQYFQTLYPSIPVEKVPWIWTPDIVETHRKQIQSPVWAQIYGIVPKDVHWSLHVAENNNMSNSSSCTLPLTILREALLSKTLPINRVFIHNTDLLQNNKFFIENVFKHCEVPDISYNLIGRQRIIDWVMEPHSILLSHSRFVPLKLANLEAAWVGLPVIHNSSILRDLGCGLERLFYKNNSVNGACEALHNAILDTSGVPYLVSTDAMAELRKKILTAFYPLARAQEWATVAGRAFASTNVVEVTVAPAASSPPAIEMKPIRILFTDMWDQFNEKYNMFTLAVSTALKTKGTTVEGYTTETLPAGSTPDLVIFGPFGEEWKALPEAWPKAHFTGENTKPVEAAGVKLNIGYKLPEMSTDSYLRMPLWMFEIDWFGADPNKIQNPIPLPIDTVIKADPASYEKRSKFCAFVVTNPKNHVRNQAFMTLNAYKPVDSAGRLFNNVGDMIFAGLGGGGGELKKHEFLKGYRFCIAYENESAPGYTTEKLLHAKAAGCVPIYWGDPKVGRDFNTRGFLNASDCKSPDDLVKLVDSVESDPARWRELASVPALDTYNRDLVRRTFAEMVKRFITIAGRSDLLEGLPSFLGAKTSADATALRKEREGDMAIAGPHVCEIKETVMTQVPPTAIQTPVQVETPFVVTTSTQRFWTSALMWLTTMEKHRVALPDLRTRVYVGADVSEAALELTTEKYKGFAEFVRLPTETPEGFTDFWAPQHYAWKLWAYHNLTNDPSLKGRLVVYTDCASVTLRWPSEWMAKATEAGVCALEDPRQTNRQWCHQTFCQRLAVTEAEKDSQQIWAGGMAFVAGSPQANALFEESYKWGQIRDVIVGEKWVGFGPDGKPTGHRHDQSILSVISQRQGVARFPLDRVYGDRSARATFHSGQAIYVHRGNYQAHQPILPGIDDAFVINLDRREDRKKAFLEANPDLRGLVRRMPAYDGRKLTLTPSLARMFKPNDFFWKKAVMGCALSHMKVWTHLINEPPEIESLLILEDDARLKPGWREAWIKAQPNLPEDWDCVYLGGILPPNRAGFANCLERVGPGLARVAPNQMFGQKEANRYFHFCAYAYVLSKRGAAKILESILDRDGYWTSADHMVCNRIDVMNLYVLDPLVAGASQDDDPIYQKAEFNNFSRVDNFDSDLWNNDERFTPEEIQASMGQGTPLQITATFAEVEVALRGQAVDVQAPVAVAAVAAVAAVSSEVVLPKRKGPRFVSLDSMNLHGPGLYEAKWLQDLFQGIDFVIDPVAIADTLEGEDDLIAVVIQSPLFNNDWVKQITWLDSLRSAGHRFKILHLSDEYGRDPIDFYSWPEVTGVMRFYARADLPVDPKILVLPLGYHWQFPGNRDVPHISTPELPFRENTWSFAGTDWKGRKGSMGALQSVQPHFLRWFDGWQHPDQLTEEEYLALLLNSKFVPCPRGQNVETYRFYEALECGCIPLFIREEGDEGFLKQFDGCMPFINLSGWDHAAALMLHLSQNPDMMDKYRKGILIGWARYKMVLKERVRKWFNEGKIEQSTIAL